MSLCRRFSTHPRPMPKPRPRSPIKTSRRVHSQRTLGQPPGTRRQDVYFAGFRVRFHGHAPRAKMCVLELLTFTSVPLAKIGRGRRSRAPYPGSANLESVPEVERSWQRGTGSESSRCLSPFAGGAGVEMGTGAARLRPAPVPISTLPGLVGQTLSGNQVVSKYVPGSAARPGLPARLSWSFVQSDLERDPFFPKRTALKR